MQGVRFHRVVSVVVLALVAGLSLVGCQSQPGTALYVGDTRYTDDQIDSMVRTIQGNVDKAAPGQSFPQGDLRVVVVQLVVFNELAKRYAADHGITVPPADYNAASADIGLPPDDPLVRLSADEDAYRTALLASVPPVQPAEPDVRAAYDKLVHDGADLAPYAQVGPEIAKLSSFPGGLTLKAALAQTADRYAVGVSPRYQPLELPLTSVNLGKSYALVSLPVGQIGGGSPAVSDI